MFKKIIAASLSTLMMSSAFAAFYAGGTLGIVTNTSKNGNYRGILPLVNIGYDQMVTPEVYMAGELYGTTSTIVISDDTGTANSLRSTRMIGAAFIPGYTITESILGYVRLGLMNTRFPSAGTSRIGLNTGVGLATPLTEFWHLRMEYDYTAYRSQNTIGATKSDQFMVSLIYHFI